MKKHFWKIVLATAVVLMGGSIIYAQYASTKANEGVTLSPHVKGNPDAAVVLTEYGDFQCPACAQFHPLVKDLVAQYGDSIAFEYKHFPLVAIHPFAVPAAKAAEAAGVQGKFFEMHDKLFENQNSWSRSAAPQAFFVKYAEEIGLDVPLFKQHMRASLIDDHVSSQFSEAQEKGLTSTPSFLLNGVRMEYTSYADFIAAIEVALGVSTSTATSALQAAPQTVEFGIPAQ